MLAAAPSRPCRRLRSRERASLRGRWFGGRKSQNPGRGKAVSGRRFYDPKNGRFIGRDPISEGGGLNLHGFVQNNPVNGWDYLGQYAIMERTENSVSLTIPIYFGPGVTAEMKAQWIAAIQERWKGEFDGLKVSTTVVEMTELPTAKNRGNTVNILPAARNGISNYGRDPRTGNGILNIYENQATPSTVVHEVGHAMGLKDVYLRKWLNLDTSEYEWHDQNNPPRGKKLRKNFGNENTS